MDFDLFSCTLETLSNLKFNELRKISSHYGVNKRWAKKNEMIDKLLQLRDEEIQKKNTSPASFGNNLPEDDSIKWVDGAEALLNNDMIEQDSNGMNKRLTYCVTDAVSSSDDARSTFSVNKTGDQTLVPNPVDPLERRLTYVVRDAKLRRETFCISSNKPKMETLTECNENATSVNEIPATEGSTDINNAGMDELGVKTEKEPLTTKQGIKNGVIGVNVEGVNGKNKEFGKEASTTISKVKPLTVPYTRVPGNNRKATVQDAKSNPAKFKMTNRSDILEKKQNVAEKHQRNNAEMNKSMKLLKLPTTNKANIGQNKIQAKASVHNLTVPMSVSRPANADNRTRLLHRRKSKTEDNVLVKNLRERHELKFFSPREANRRLSDGNRGMSNDTTLDTGLKSKIPRAKLSIQVQKPIRATKMPDFSKIHMKRFEQMDSLHDYQRKKEERAKKLFGIAQPGIPVRVNNKNDENSVVFEFKSNQNEKENQPNKTVNSTAVKANGKESSGRERVDRKTVLNRNGSKPDILSSLKEQNRKHMNGVRTNKRFELQMKFRNL